MQPSVTVHTRRRLVATFVAWVCAWLGPVTVFAQSSGSPFLPPGFGAKAPPKEAATGPLDSVEFRGVLTLDGKTFITLFDSSSSKSFTAEVGQTINNIKVAKYSLEGDDDSVVLESGGKTRRVGLKKAKIVAMAVPPPNAAPLPAGTPPPKSGQAATRPNAAGIGQMSDDEVRQRMQRVAEEIRRRRAVRRQQLEQSRQQNQQRR